jgi:tetratricopeptide (TPR) repeat protein
MVLGGFTVSEFYRAARGRDRRLMVWLGIGVVAVFLLSSSRFWNVGKEGWPAQYLINEAALYLQEGDFDRAVEVYEEAIETEPDNARVYYYLGKALATEGLVDESKEMMDKAMRLNPTYRPYALLSLGVGMANKGRYEVAVQYFTQALEADSGLGLAAFNLGISLLNLGRAAEADRAFTRAEKLCKEDLGTLIAISRAYIRMGESQKGISLAEVVLGRDPGNAEALYAIGLGLEAQGRAAEALRYYEAALRSRPGSPEIMQKIRRLRTGRSSG